MKRWFLLGVGAVVVFLVVFFAGTKPAPTEESKQEETSMSQGQQWEKAPEMVIDTKKSYTAIIKTSKGDMKVELFDDETPKTVNNFVFLARADFYNNGIFHRIIKDFMIQGGDPEGTGGGGPGYTFEDETITRDYKRGTIAMANRGPNTNGSQFFIIHQDYNLPKNYTIFGQISPTDTESLKTLDVIAETPVESSESGENSKPKEVVTITSVLIEEK